MSMSRKDSKGRVLRKGESQRKNDGRYIYQYTDSTGKRRVVYSNDLLELREKEKELVRNQLDGLESYCSGKTTLNYAFDRYISTKYDLKEHTRVNYKYMYNRFVRDTFGKRIINDIKYSDVKFFYCSLMNILGLQANTLDNIHTILHPTFQMAVRDNVIRNNPASGVMAEIKKANGKNKGIRHALTLEQQRAFLNYVSNSPVYCHWLPLFTALFGTGCRIGDDDDKIRLNQRKPSKYKGLRRFGPEKNLQRINKFMKERPTFYKKLIQMKENFRFYLRCFYCITKVMILQFNSENRTELARNG